MAPSSASQPAFHSHHPRGGYTGTPEWKEHHVMLESCRTAWVPAHALSPALPLFLQALVHWPSSVKLDRSLRNIHFPQAL